MNIFILDRDPEVAAQMQCDQHVVKMPLETAQMLCTAYPEGIAPYAYTHYNHPCNKWLRQSSENYQWLIVHGLALCSEYTYRYEKVHSSEKVIFWCWANMDKINFLETELTPFPKAMDERHKTNDPVESYRRFYCQEKSSFANWNKNRRPPIWFSRC